jgi:hypothetical protein
VRQRQVGRVRPSSALRDPPWSTATNGCAPATAELQSTALGLRITAHSLAALTSSFGTQYQSRTRTTLSPRWEPNGRAELASSPVLFAENSARQTAGQQSEAAQLSTFFFGFHRRIRGACSHTPLPLVFLQELFANSLAGKPDWTLAETVLDAHGRQVLAGDASRVRLSKWLFGNLHNYHHLQQEATKLRLLAVAKKLEQLQASGTAGINTRQRRRPAPKSPCRSVLHRQYGLGEDHAKQPLWFHSGKPWFKEFLQSLWCGPTVARQAGTKHNNECFLSFPPEALRTLAAESDLVDYEQEYIPPPDSGRSNLASEEHTGQSAQQEQPAATAPQPAATAPQPEVAAQPALATETLNQIVSASIAAALPVLLNAARASAAAAPAAQAAPPKTPPAASSNSAPPAQPEETAPQRRVTVHQRLGAAGQSRRRNHPPAQEQRRDNPPAQEQRRDNPPAQEQRRDNPPAQEQRRDNPADRQRADAGGAEEPTFLGWLPHSSAITDALRHPPASNLSEAGREQVIVWGTVSRILVAYLAQAARHANDNHRNHGFKRRRTEGPTDGGAPN